MFKLPRRYWKLGLVKGGSNVHFPVCEKDDIQTLEHTKLFDWPLDSRFQSMQGNLFFRQRLQYGQFCLFSPGLIPELIALMNVCMPSKNYLFVCYTLVRFVDASFFKF